MVTFFLLALTPYLSVLSCSVVLLILGGTMGWHALCSTSHRLGYFIDQLSRLIICITIILLVLMIYSTQPQSLLVSTFITLLFILCLIISTTSIIIFYVWFEFSLLPMIIVILGWGKQPERLIASLYMFIYTVTGSFPFLFVILYNKLILIDPSWITPKSFVVRLCILVPFCVKLPMYYFHLWLPKAHVEAPVFGSIVLAATLLKIGSYGVWRLSLLLNYSICLVVIRIRLLRASLCSWVTLSQVDIKAIIAYSRVVHIGIVIRAVLISRYTSSLPALIIMISHGICSSGLFYTATLRYERISTRSMPIIQGLSIIRPALTLPWVILLLINLRSPPTLSLISELFISRALLIVDCTLLVGIIVIIVIVLIYSLILFYSVYHGHILHSTQRYYDNLKQLTIVNTHSVWFVLWLLGIWLYEI